MVNETIQRIEEQLRNNQAIDGQQRSDLIALIARLKEEVALLALTNHDDARSITGFTETSVHEATRQEVDPELLQHSIDGLSKSVKRFEISHPTLVGLINNIGQTLWNIGI
jgi:hypothetical protein